MDSKLQIISGTYRGRKLVLPDGARPTQNMARAAVFNMLAEIFQQSTNISAWDAFAGAGAMGIEVLSRYPSAKVFFTDISDESIKAIKKNATGIAANRICITKISAIKAIKVYAQNANLIFVDPPYADAGIGIEFVAEMAKIVRGGAIVVQEIEKNVPYAPDESEWEILRDKVYGRARFLILRRNNNK